MSTSKLAGLAKEAGGLLETLRNLSEQPRSKQYDLVLLDIQAFQEDQLCWSLKCGFFWTVLAKKA